MKENYEWFVDSTPFSPFLWSIHHKHLKYLTLLGLKTIISFGDEPLHVPKNILGIMWLVTKVIFGDYLVSNMCPLVFKYCNNIIVIETPPKVFFLEKFSQINEKYASAKLHENKMIRSQDNWEGYHFCHPGKSWT